MFFVPEQSSFLWILWIMIPWCCHVAVFFYEILPWSMFIIFLTFLIISLNPHPLEVNGLKGRFWLFFIWVMYCIYLGVVGVHFAICEMRTCFAPHIWDIITLSHDLNFELHWVVWYFDIVFRCWILPLLLKVQ
jgi:hypothetical protein